MNSCGFVSLCQKSCEFDHNLEHTKNNAAENQEYQLKCLQNNDGRNEDKWEFQQSKQFTNKSNYSTKPIIQRRTLQPSHTLN